MRRGFNTVNAATNKLVKNLKTAGSAALRFGTVATGAIAAGLTGLITQFSKVENAEAAFTPLLGGAERAKQAVQALNDTAATTPFQFETLASSMNQLLPVMDGNIEDTIKTVRMLGDTAGGNAQKLDSITRGFTKAMLKGKVDMESLNMIAEAGVPIFNDLADVVGVEMGESFFKMVSAGKISTAQLTKAFEKMTSEGGIFFRGMEIASQTTSGLFSTLKDNVSLTAAELGGALAPEVKGIIVDLTKVAQQVRQWATDNREIIGQRFSQVVDGIRASLSDFLRVAKGIGQLIVLLGAFKIALIAVSVAMGIVRAATIAWTVSLAVLKGALIVFKTVLGAFRVAMLAVNLVMLVNPIGALVAGIGLLIAAGAFLVTNWERIPAIFAGIWEKIKSTFKGGTEFVKNAVGLVASPFSNIIGGVAGIVQNFNQDEDLQNGAAGSAGVVGTISPQDRLAKSVEETRKTSTAEVTIKDETGRAELTDGELGTGISLQNSGTP
jgi:tape measure domain-containing protein